MMVQVVPSALAVIFVICPSRFAFALTLGGGPRATTIELAIYQAVRFEFDFPTAAMLGLVQLGLSVILALLTVFLGMREGFGFGFGLDRPVFLQSRPLMECLWDGAIISLAVLFLVLPLAILLSKGIPDLGQLPMPVWMAAVRSVLLALGASALCLLLAVPLATRSGEVIGILGIAVSPLVLGMRIFLIIRPYVNPFNMALIVTLCINAVLSPPFVLRVLRPNVEQTLQSYSKLLQSLGLGAWARFRWMIWPRLRRPMGFSAGLISALSMGDLGVITLFGYAERATLSFKIYELMGSYRMEEAPSSAVLLLILSLGLFWGFDKWGRRNAAH